MTFWVNPSQRYADPSPQKEPFSFQSRKGNQNKPRSEVDHKEILLSKFLYTKEAPKAQDLNADQFWAGKATERPKWRNFLKHLFPHNTWYTNISLQ